eukprot:TRINITY_DN11313_c0_g1_i1.p1 TRINITY_DN11313_c0_g1~~TRINITY_DN11313_c0_g1_i1.p1  ORF type:complete len:298 (+),score=54.73 TRINITY_DN11313_c0_g1_i1:109-1002(+)
MEISKSKYLVFGSTGWIGGMIVELLQKNPHADVSCAKSRLEDRASIQREIDEYKPNYIMNCAGVTGRPNVDWCEDHKQETIRSNVIGTLNLCDVAFLNSIHVTNFATGCIYEYDESHEMHSGVGFTEMDKPNFVGSFYSKTKAMVEDLLSNYSNVLTLRVRMPLSDDLHPRNFITKITKYEKVVNVPNSMSILHDLLPLSIDMTKKNLRGVYNFTNPGVITHNEILELYKKHIDPQFKWTNFTVEEQSKILKAPRSNNLLNTSKLEALYPDLNEVHKGIEQLFVRMAERLKHRTAQN